MNLPAIARLQEERQGGPWLYLGFGDLAGFCCWGDTSPNAGDDHLGPRALRGPAGHLPAWHWLLPRSSRTAWAKQCPTPPRIPRYLPPFNGCCEEHHFSFLLKFSVHIHRAQKSGSPAVLSANVKTGKSCLPPGFTLLIHCVQSRLLHPDCFLSSLKA